MIRITDAGSGIYGAYENGAFSPDKWKEYMDIPGLRELCPVVSSGY